MKKEKGITLIALIITIIVLLILAGVSLKLIAGNEGILGRAEKAVTKNDEASAREKLELELQGLLIARKSGEKFNLEDELTNKGFIVDGDMVTVDGYQFKIDEDKLQIVESLGKGEKNEAIIIETTSEISEDGTTATLTIDNTDGTITSVQVSGKEAREQDGKYVIEITENGTYTIVAKNSAGEYNTKTITISDLKEDLKISTVQELVAFAQSVNAGKTYEGQVVRLKNDLDLKGINWEPIGYWMNETDNKEFNGTFDGENHTISNLTINMLSQPSDDYWGAGFIGILGDGTLKNIKFSNANIHSAVTGTGIAVGDIERNATIENVETLNGEINTTAAYAGGICGNMNAGKIVNCVNRANVNSQESYIAGICGSMINANIADCTNNAKVKSNGGYTGGICGSISQGNVNRCGNNGEIISTESENSIGGIAGFIANRTTKGLVMSYCYNKANIVASGTHNVGGIVRKFAEEIII